MNHYEPLLTIQDVADYLKIGYRNAWKIIAKNKEIKSVKIGREYRVKPDDLREYLEGI